MIGKVYSKIKQSLTILLLFGAVLFPNNNNAQTSCIDSVETIVYSSPSLNQNLALKSIATSDNGTLIFQLTPNSLNAILIKINNSKQISWAEQQYKGNQTVNSNQELRSVDQTDNGNIILSGAVYPDLCAGCLVSAHVILTPTGQFFTQADYLNENSDTGWQIANTGPNQTLVFAGKRIFANGGGITVSRQDTTDDGAGHIFWGANWANNFSFTGASTSILLISNLYVQHNSIYIAGTYLKNTAPIQENGFWALKLDYATGNLVNFKSYAINNAGISSDSLLISGKSNFTTFGNNRFSFTSELKHSSTQKKEIAFAQLDSNLNIIKNPISVSSGLNGSSNAFAMASEYFESMYLLPQNNNLFYVATIDSFNNVSYQKKILNNTANVSASGYNFKNDGTLSIVNTLNLNNNLYFQSTDLPIQFDNTSTCISVQDTSFVDVKQILCVDSKIDWSIVLPSEKYSLAGAGSAPQSIAITSNSQLACAQKSLCNTIKISGSNNFCLSDSSFVFTASKNIECLKKISWRADTAFIPSFGFVNDSSVSVQFKKAGIFYIRANVAGCSIDDSLLINIKPPSAKISIGNDTLLCPNATDTLRTKFAYQKYIWQDGSTDSFFVVKKPGTYQLTATDNCNNVSSDTVIIKYDESKLNAGLDIELCKLQDTLFTASNGFADYQWQPANEIIGSALSQTIKIAPTQTTEYIVTAKSALGCAFSDTVKAVVNNCLNRLVVPTAFSPNNDGKNELLKPIVYGVLLKYDFSIYNRWGQIVFRSAKQGEGWDGKINGSLQNNGAFIWSCKYQFAGEKERTDKGSFVLVK